MKARCIQNSDIATSPPYIREIWDWLLKEANHADNRWKKRIIKRGQLLRTYKDIREGLAWYIGYRKCMYNENQTKKAMKALREYLMITTAKELGGVLITICNYDKYQNPKNYESTNESTNESTTKEPMKNQGIPANNKNVKNGKELKKEKASCPNSKKPELDADKNKNIKVGKYLFSKFDSDMAFLLRELITKNYPDHKQEKKQILQEWANQCRLMRTIKEEKRSKEDIERLLKWYSNNEFWWDKIESMGKFRKQFEKLDKQSQGNKLIDQQTQEQKDAAFSKSMEGLNDWG